MLGQQTKKTYRHIHEVTRDVRGTVDVRADEQVERQVGAQAKFLRHRRTEKPKPKRDGLAVTSQSKH